MKPLRGGEGILVDYMARARAPSAEYQDPQRYRQAELAQAERIYRAREKSVERVRQQYGRQLSPLPNGGGDRKCVSLLFPWLCI